MSELGSGRRVGRVVMEIVAIVFSILLAFAIDAWWDSRVEHLKERQVLRDMHTEFVAAQREIHDGMGAHTGRRAALEVLGGVATGRAALPSPDSLNVLFSWLMMIGTTDPQVATLDGLQGAGDLDIIRNDRLRALLARWESDLRDAKEAEAFVVEATIRDVYGWLRQGPPMPNPWGILPDVMMPQEATDFLPYLRTREFQNLVGQHYVLETLTSGDAERQATTTSEILEVLEAELGDAGR